MDGMRGCLAEQYLGLFEKSLVFQECGQVVGAARSVGMKRSKPFRTDLVGLAENLFCLLKITTRLYE